MAQHEQRQLALPIPPEEVAWTISADVAEIAKADNDNTPCRVFGWASIIVDQDGEPLTDRQGDVILLEDLEPAAYEFVLHFRNTGEMHQGGVKGKLIESFVVTPEKLKAMGLKDGALPLGWWIGFEITDPAAIKLVRSGKYKAFSIQGKGTRTVIEDDDAAAA